MKNPEDIPLRFPDPVIEAYLQDVDRKDFEPIAELEAIRRERLSGRTDFQP